MADVLRAMPAYRGDPRRVGQGRDVGLVNALFNLVSGTVVIGDDVFFGNNPAVLTGGYDPGLTGLDRQRGYPEAGRDIVIGAGRVVMGDAEAGCLHAGVPARRIRRLAACGDAAVRSGSPPA